MSEPGGYPLIANILVIILDVLAQITKSTLFSFTWSKGGYKIKA
jgi:hypothetical protein